MRYIFVYIVIIIITFYPFSSAFEAVSTFRFTKCVFLCVKNEPFRQAKRFIEV